MSSSAENFTTHPDPNIDGGWGWVVVFITFMIRVILDGYIYTFGIFYVEHLEYFNTSGGAASLVMSILIGVTHLAGIGCGLVYLPTIVGVALHFEKKRAFAMGISMSGSGIALLVCAPLVEWLIKYYHYWKGALLILTGIVMNCFVLSFFYKTYTPFVHRPVPIDEPSTSEVTARKSTSKTHESNQPQSLSQGTQTLKKGEEIQGLDTISSNNVRSGTSTSAHLSGLMQKSDILYTGSSTSLLKLSRQLQTTPSMVTRTDRTEIQRRGVCAIFKDIVVQMVGTSLLKNYAFLIFSLGTFLHYFGLIAPCVYLYHKAIEMNIATSAEASLLLSLMGVANTIGKIAIGYWADRTSVSVLNIYTVCLLITGISTMMTSLITNYFLMVLYIFVYGISWGGSIGLSSILMVSLFGMQNLSNAYGLFLLFIGVSTAAGTPITGVLHDITSNYDAGFYLSGGVITLGSLLLFVIPSVRRRFPQY
ncbi:Monocarboxylate transporter 14 [Araneus ventricosus]|uniref:Monocarboxylate transporter 14 n=1 Tax=Araneus ventricosus TaxID=182803 RepID=A0A4Y2GTE4_ARAVE|nr:Monocarboxylate transporter 14 [Araneus ventricosus]